MSYIANRPNVYEDEEELTRILRDAGLNVFTKDRVERGAKRKKILVGIKGGGCESCGYDKNYAALDFHHNTGKKNFTIGRAIQDFTDRQFEEILIPEVKELTVLLCANCHREEHN